LEVRSNRKDDLRKTKFLDRTFFFLHECQRGHIVCMELLVLVGCDTTATDALGRTGLMLAAAHGHVDMIQKLLDLWAGGSIELEATLQRRLQRR
jgi:ankyrin repeat protein